MGVCHIGGYETLILKEVLARKEIVKLVVQCISSDKYVCDLGDIKLV